MYRDVKEAQAGVGQFNTEWATLLKSGVDAKDEGHKRSWQIVSVGYKVAHALQDSPEVRAKLLTMASIADNADNPFTAVVRMLYRKKGKFNASAKKYAQVMRFAYDTGWTPEEFVDRIAGLTAEVDGKKVAKLQAAELLDRQKYGVAEDPAKVAAALDYLKEERNLGMIAGDQIQLEGREDGSWVTVAAQWDAQLGAYVSRAVVSTNSAGIAAQVKKEALRLYDRHTEELMKEVTMHNADVTVLNRMDPAMRRAHAARIKDEGKFDWDELNARFIELPVSETQVSSEVA